MTEIVKPYAGDEYGKTAARLSEIAGECDIGEVQAIAVIVLRADKPFELHAWADEVDRSKLRGAAMELAAALAAD